MTELEKIEQYVNLSLGIVINQKTRKRPIVYGRNLFYALARKCTEHTLEDIGKYFGREDNDLTIDHATVLYGNNIFQDILIDIEEYKRPYDSYLFAYLVDIVDKKNQDKEDIKKLLKENEINIEDENDRLQRLLFLKITENKRLNKAIDLFGEQATKLHTKINDLKLKLNKKESFLYNYYNLNDKERETVKERLDLIIRLMPSNQKRKEETKYELIKCEV